MLYYNLVLPVEGSPYIEGCAQPDGGKLETLQKIVGGRIERVSPWTIHPMFLDNKRWSIAEVMRKTKGVKMYVNEKGMYHCSPNMATMITDNVIILAVALTCSAILPLLSPCQSLRLSKSILNV